MIRLALIVALLLTGCAGEGFDNYPKWEPDQQMRAARFDACMKSLPAGPVSTRYNDWDEVVEACGQQAYYQSLVCVANCPTMPARSTP